MSVEQLCMIAMVLMFGGFLLGVWREASRWMRETNEREGQVWDGSFDTRDMEVAYSEALARISARARLQEMRKAHRISAIQMTSTVIPLAERLAASPASPPSHLIYGVQSLGDSQGVRLHNTQANAHYAQSTNYNN